MFVNLSWFMGYEDDEVVTKRGGSKSCVEQRGLA